MGPSASRSLVLLTPLFSFIRSIVYFTRLWVHKAGLDMLDLESSSPCMSTNPVVGACSLRSWKQSYTTRPCQALFLADRKDNGCTASAVCRSFRHLSLLIPIDVVFHSLGRML
ncbi:hypothetical protein C8F04DRAFT_665790 [Mycena alexandri]|uniref:Uncharacterized protein n=1 Tax=Mycena alexandri TaxID=1745969 RepID=A0AAD6STE8_9AGAR|nr:hypothetical protein C8F04DRAFT_665790 [Mycena alexandri]